MFKTSLAACTAGFAMFAMFFGSGNLVFPLQVGANTTSNFSYATIGLFITGIVVPFIGLISMVVHHKQPRDYFKRLGPTVSLILIFLMLALMGPFGVGPRCILVAYGGMKLVFSNLSLLWFSLSFCALAGLMIWFHETMITIIGRFLTPILLLTIIAVILFGIYYAKTPTTSVETETDAFKTGIFFGYQTMDLLAAFFFSASIIRYFSNNIDHAHLLLSKKMLAAIACIIGIILLGLVYTGFVSLGASYSEIISTVPPEQMLAKIAEKTLGNYALPIMAVLIFIACLTTLVVLMDLFAEFLEFDLFKQKVPRAISVILTLIITFFVSLIGFEELARWIASALFFAYPALIAFAIASIIEDLYKIKIVKHIFFGVLILIVLTQLKL